MLESLERRTLIAGLPPGFEEDVIATGLSQPTAMAFAPDDRLFVAAGKNNRGDNAPSLSTRLGKILRINAGGAFYSPNVRTFGKRYAGDYFFADLASGWIRLFDTVTRQVVGFATGIDMPVAIETDNADGSLWYLARGSGDNSGHVVRIDRTGP